MLILLSAAGLAMAVKPYYALSSPTVLSLTPNPSLSMNKYLCLVCITSLLHGVSHTRQTYGVFQVSVSICRAGIVLQ